MAYSPVLSDARELARKQASEDREAMLGVLLFLGAFSAILAGLFGLLVLLFG